MLLKEESILLSPWTSKRMQQNCSLSTAAIEHFSMFAACVFREQFYTF